MKVGDKYKPASGIYGGFEVTAVTSKETTVNVQRRNVTKDGEIKFETRERIVPKDVLPFFLKGYRKDTKRA